MLKTKCLYAEKKFVDFLTVKSISDLRMRQRKDS